MLMKKLLLLSIIFAIAFTCYAQEEGVEQEYSKRELKKIAKEEKKAQRAAEAEQQKAIVELMLEMHRFVLEAQHLSGKSGQRIPVTSTLNFIGVDSVNAVIQLGTVSGAPGYNGVGGITVDGRITKYDLKVIEGKKGKSYTLMLNVMSSIGIFDITFMISESGYTDATIRSTTSGVLNYSGNLVPIYKSRVYKGSSIY